MRAWQLERYYKALGGVPDCKQQIVDSRESDTIINVEKRRMNMSESSCVVGRGAGREEGRKRQLRRGRNLFSATANGFG